MSTEPQARLEVSTQVVEQLHAMVRGGATSQVDASLNDTQGPLDTPANDQPSPQNHPHNDQSYT